ncbi:MAG: hypothetical protein ABW133_01480 [Polyangiaceae bacterium]
MRNASLSELADQSGASRAAGSAVGTGRRGRPRGRPAGVAGAPVSTVRRGASAGGRRRRRASPDEVAKQKEAALAAAKGLRPGFSKGDVMSKSGSKTDLGRALSLLVSEGKLTKKGDRRMTRYWVK